MSSDGRTGEQLESDKVDQKADSCVTRAEVNVTEQDRIDEPPPIMVNPTG